jgi:hemoglobin
MLKRTSPFFIAPIVAAFAISCAQAAAPALTLFERMGGAATVSAMANELIDDTVAHPELKRSFEGVYLPRVKALLVDHLCNVTGGPCAYTGDTMLDVHAGLKITEAEMNGMVEILSKVMIRHRIGIRERNELLALLAPMKRDVVTR